MSIDQIDPHKAHELMGQGYTYLDVRSIPEFDRGHAPGARNVPLLHFHGQGMVPNPDFLRVVQANIPKDTKLVVGCAAGGRSQKACEELLAAGYTVLSNIRGGFSGKRDSAGNLEAKGWAELGLPVSGDAKDGESYASLEKNA